MANPTTTVDSWSTHYKNHHTPGDLNQKKSSILDIYHHGTLEDLVSDGVAQDLVEGREDTENRLPAEAEVLLSLHHGYVGEKNADIIQYADHAAAR
jgi:hypothetical protein